MYYREVKKRFTQSIVEIEERPKFLHHDGSSAPENVTFNIEIPAFELAVEGLHENGLALHNSGAEKGAHRKLNQLLDLCRIRIERRLMEAARDKRLHDKVTRRNIKS